MYVDVVYGALQWSDMSVRPILRLKLNMHLLLSYASEGLFYKAVLLLLQLSCPHDF